MIDVLNCVGYTDAVCAQSRSHTPMQGLEVQLVLGLDGHKAHPRPLYRFGHGFRI
jgi:hypothetical protein